MAARNDGKTGFKADKLWTDALRRAVLRAAEDGKPTKRLEIIANQCAKKAMEGDITAMKEIGDRLDGRPTQTLAGDPDSPHKLVIEIRDPTRPNEPDKS